jgi:hypothetical protein
MQYAGTLVHLLLLFWGPSGGYAVSHAHLQRLAVV